jgi:hypothetical protein
MMQALDFARARSFQIQHHRPGAVPDNRRTDLLVRARQINRIEVMGETDRQSLCSSGVILIKDYTEWFHTFPLTTPQIAAALAATADTAIAGVGNSDPSTTALLTQRFLGRGLERFRLQLPVLF